MANSKLRNFSSKHPIIFNLILIIVLNCILLVVAYFGLAIFTHHNKYQVVPDLKGLEVTQAAVVLSAHNLKCEISDSVYEAAVAPGCIIDQIPKAGSKIKDNRSIYVTIRSYSTRLVTIPAITDMSMRQGLSTLQGIGLKNVEVERIHSEFPDLVYGVEMNGLPLNPGDKVPVNARLKMLVGDGMLAVSDTDILNEYNSAIISSQYGDSTDTVYDYYE